MKNPRVMIAVAGLSAAALGGGVGAVAIATNGTPLAAATPASMAQSPSVFASSSPPVITEVVATQTNSTVTTVHTAKVKVGNATEAILVNAKGLPLYFYKPDTASRSKVTGALAALWPPLDAKHPTASGTSGVVSTVFTANRHQVAYNGHFLYTFAEDSARHVTGQGVQNFFVATPRIAVNHGNAATTKSVPAPAPSNNGYGY
jgi:predicted lipoprotein with Yx(FWY)xxD motif